MTGVAVVRMAGALHVVVNDAADPIDKYRLSVDPQMQSGAGGEPLVLYDPYYPLNEFTPVSPAFPGGIIKPIFRD